MTVDEPSPAGVGAGPHRLSGYAQAYREAVDITNAYRARLKTAVLDEIDAGLSITEAAQLIRMSASTVHEWIRDR